MTKLGEIVSVTLLVSVSWIASCTNAQPSSGSGVGEAKLMAALTDGEKARFCDWLNGMEGGYGRSYECADALVAATDDDQADCVESFTKCAASVRQMEACARKIAGDMCNPAGASSPECRAVRHCF